MTTTSRLFAIFCALFGVLQTNALAVDSDAIAISILKSPSWDYYAYEKGADKAVIESILPLAGLNNDECRAVIKALMLLQDTNPIRNKWFKAMVANRLIFDIPDDFKRSGSVSVSGFLSPIEVNWDDTLLLWPIEKRGGFFRIASRSGGYSGADYDGLKEFDYFANKFKRRLKGSASVSNW